ncbi:MAG: hypothetical protein IKI57_00700 [Clostridia bacterium]|nr:hypothetical protein [Clostridia bacterium]
MKHIIIAGAPRSGKTTISRELTAFSGCVHYRLDSIKRAVFEIFCPGKKDWHFASKMTVKIIQKLVDDNNQESVRKEYFIFDTPHLYPEDVVELNPEEFIVVFVGYTDIDVSEKVESILKYDAETCWTQKLSKEKLTSLVEGNIRFSKEIKEQCEKYNLPYFDVSTDPLRVLNDVKRFVKANL